MSIAPAEGLQVGRRDSVMGSGTEIAARENGLLHSGWDGGAIHVVYIVLLSPSHRDDTVLAICVIYVKLGGGESCHKFSTLTSLWLL